MWKIIYSVAVLISTLTMVSSTSYHRVLMADIEHHSQWSTADDYTFEVKEFEHKDLHVTVVVHPNQAELSAGMTTDVPGQYVMAYTYSSPNSNTCIIHIVDPY